MSLVTRKPVFGVCDLVRHKPACAATETSKSPEILDLESRDIILSRQRTTKVLIRLHECAGGSAPLLFAYGINRFSHDVAQIMLEMVVHREYEIFQTKSLNPISVLEAALKKPF